MKKIVLSFVAAFVLLFSVCIAGCDGCGKKGGNYSETFKGAVSEETYETHDDAVQGFLDTEISGKTTKAVLVSYTKEKELSVNEVNSLAIDEEYKEGLISVEKGNVKYKENSVTSAQASLCSAESGETRDKVIYILTYTGVFRFFTPAVDNGDTLTSSYFDSTFDGEKYLNCTMEATIRTEGSQGGVKYTQENTATAKVTHEALYEHDEVKATVNGQDVPSTELGGNNVDVYILDTSDGLYQLQKKSDSWQALNLTNSNLGMYRAENVNDYFMMWFKQRFNELDHTYFEKTSTGYALRADKYNDFIKTQQGMSSLGSDFDLSYVINISEGRFSDVSMKIGLTVQGASATTEMVIKFKDFGTTSIDVPAEVKNALPEGVTVGKAK